jgi:hypothetical protein
MSTQLLLILLCLHLYRAIAAIEASASPLKPVFNEINLLADAWRSKHKRESVTLLAVIDYLH